MLRWFLPIYATAYLGVLFAWRSYRVWKQTGVNPIVFGKTDKAHDYVGGAMKWMILLVGFVIVVHTFIPGWASYLMPFPWLEIRALKGVGLVLALASFVWVAVAQVQMGASFRVGVDEERRTEMIARGLFRVSRNPIFLGLTVTLVGFFLVLPNAFTLLTLILGRILMQIQVRLEEEHLEKLHGESYLAFRRRVRRWL